MPSRASHRWIRQAMNSGPLSLRRKCGAPRRATSCAGTGKTRSPAASVPPQRDFQRVLRERERLNCAFALSDCVGRAPQAGEGGAQRLEMGAHGAARRRAAPRRRAPRRRTAAARVRVHPNRGHEAVACERLSTISQSLVNAGSFQRPKRFTQRATRGEVAYLSVQPAGCLRHSAAGFEQLGGDETLVITERAQRVWSVRNALSASPVSARASAR